MAIGTTAAILGAAAIGAGTSIYASNKAAKAQKNAAQAGLAAEQQMYEQSRADLAPWRAAGGSALSEYAAQMGIPGYQRNINFQASPGYDWRVQQGIRAVNQGAGASGMLRSGARLKALTDYGQNQASEEYGNWMNRLAALSGIGQTTAVTQAAQNASSAQQRADLYGQQGAARASGYQGIANGINSGLSNLSGFAGQQGWFSGNKTPVPMYNPPNYGGF